MKALVAVASRHGATLEIAQVIHDELKAGGIEAELVAAEVVESLADYDAVVLGSAVYLGRWLPEASNFVERHQEALRAMPVWIFSSGPTGEHPVPEGIPAPIPDLMLETEARGHRLFGGKLDPAALGLSEWLVARTVDAPPGDYRDWDAIRAWTREIGAALGDATRPPLAR